MTDKNIDTSHIEMMRRSRFFVFPNQQGKTVDEVQSAILQYNAEHAEDTIIAQKRGIGLYEINYSTGEDTPLEEVNLQTKLTRTFEWGHYTTKQVKNDEGQKINAQIWCSKEPKRAVFESVCTASEIDKHRLPVYTTLVNGAIVDTDGNIYSTKGHCAKHEIILTNDFEIPEIPKEIREEDVENAKSVFFDILKEFCFKVENGEKLQDSVSYQNAIFCLLCMVIRPTWRGPTPIFVITKTSERVGGTLLVDTLSTMAFNKSSSQILFAKSADENEKAIKTKIVESPTCCMIDNVEPNAEWAFPSLLSVTSGGVDKKSDIRVFGKLESVHREAQTLWLVNGKQVTVSADVAGRTVVIPLEAPTSWSALTFKRTKNELLKDAAKSHPTVIWAAAVLIKNWVQQGRPAAKKLNGNFSEYQDLYSFIGGIMTAAGYDRFLDNLADIQKSENENETKGKKLIDLLYGLFKEKKFTTSDLINVMKSEVHEQEDIESRAHDYDKDISMILLNSYEAKDVAHLSGSKVGNKLKPYLDRHFDESAYTLTKVRTKEGVRYKIISPPKTLEEFAQTV